MAIQQQNEAHPCWEKDPTGTCYCERFFDTASGLEKHKCRFARCATSTLDSVKKLYCDLQDGNTSAPTGGGRLDAARAADPDGGTVAGNGSLFGFSLSDVVRVQRGVRVRAAAAAHPSPGSRRPRASLRSGSGRTLPSDMPTMATFAPVALSTAMSDVTAAA